MSLLFEADKAVITDNEVVEKGDIEDTASFDQPLRHGNVFAARVGVAGRMVMEYDNRVSIMEQSGFVDVKNGDVVNFMPSSPSGSFILTFSNEKTTDRYEVVMREIEKTGKGYISWMHPLYEGI